MPDSNVAGPPVVQMSLAEYESLTLVAAATRSAIALLRADLAEARAERDQVEEANKTLSAQNTALVEELNEAESALTRAHAELVAWDESWRGTQHVERLEAELVAARDDVERLRAALTKIAACDMNYIARQALGRTKASPTQPARPEPDPPGGL